MVDQIPSRTPQDRVYWRERDGEVKFANKFTGNQFMTVPVVSEGGEKLAVGSGLRIYHPVIQPESTPRYIVRFLYEKKKS